MRAHDLDETKKLTTQQRFEKNLAKYGYDVNDRLKYWTQQVKDIEAQLAAHDKMQHKDNTNSDAVTEDKTDEKIVKFVDWVLSQGDKYKNFTTKPEVYAAAKKAYKAFTKSKSQDVAESDPSGLMHAAKYLNNEYIVTAKTAEGPTKQYRVRAQSERAARERFAKHHSQATIVDVKSVASENTIETVEENLRNWFKEKWVRFGPDGKIRGDCARGDDSEGKPKCLPQSKAHSLGQKGRASAAARKRRQDPNPERSGPAINVNTKKKSNEGVAEAYQYDESNIMYRYDVDRGRLVQAMIHNRNDRTARQQGYRDTPEQALSVHRIFRSKFNPKKFMQRQGTGYVEVFPYGKPNDRAVSETRKLSPQEKFKRSMARAGYDMDAGAKRLLDLLARQKKEREEREEKEKNTDNHRQQCPECGGAMYEESMMNEKKDACYYKVKSRYKVWPSAYASGALVKCRKKGASNWGNSTNEDAAATTPVTELTDKLLSKYKELAGRQASQLDKEAFAGSQDAEKKIAKSNKRFSGIIKATNKQFQHDQKKSAAGDQQ